MVFVISNAFVCEAACADPGDARMDDIARGQRHHRTEGSCQQDIARLQWLAARG
nr:H260 [uncultured bacterium]